MKIKHKLTNFIYPNLLTTFPMLIFAAAIIFFKLDRNISMSDQMHLIVWFAAFVTVLLCQGALAIWFQFTKNRLKWDNLYSKLLMINAGIVGALWGIAGVILMPADIVGQSYLIFALAFVAAGGLIYLTGSYLAGSIYVSGVLIPLAGYLYFLSLQNHHEIYFNLTLGVVCYWALLLASIYYGSQLYAENFTLRFANKILAEDLSYTSEELEKINSISRAEKERIFLTQMQEMVGDKKISLYSVPLIVLDTQEILEIKFAQARAYARRHRQGLGVFSIDIINFNDLKMTLGENIHLLLEIIALRLHHCKRETDILALSKDNKSRFILIFSEVLFGNEITAITNKIFKALEQDIIINEHRFQINAIIGISLFPIHGEDLSELIKKSEIALDYLATGKEAPLTHELMTPKNQSLTLKFKIFSSSCDKV